jgi:hypothetical protein
MKDVTADMYACPFCDSAEVELYEVLKGFYVECPNCKSSGPLDEDFNQAISLWNNVARVMLEHTEEV